MARSLGAVVRSRGVATRLPAVPGAPARPPERRSRPWPGGPGRSLGGVAGFPPGPSGAAPLRRAWSPGAAACRPERHAVQPRPAVGGRHLPPGPGARASRAVSGAVSLLSRRRGSASRSCPRAALSPGPQGGAGHPSAPSLFAPVRPTGPTRPDGPAGPCRAAAARSPSRRGQPPDPCPARTMQPSRPCRGPRPAMPRRPRRGRPRRSQPMRLPCLSLVPGPRWPLFRHRPAGTGHRPRHRPAGEGHRPRHRPAGTSHRPRRCLALRLPGLPRGPRRPRSRSGDRPDRCRRPPQRAR